jgi:hypothetical protein
VEEHHEHAHRPHSTGFRWLDISLALSAFCVSLSTLWLTMHNARTMERLVAANSYPNVDMYWNYQFDFHDGKGPRRALPLLLENTGIGPARLRSIELSFAGKPAANLPAVLDLCCTKGEPASSLPETSTWSSGDIRGAMLPAGKELTLFAFAETPQDPRWERFKAAREKIGLRVCYCSVFDECYLREFYQHEPRRLKSCPTPAVPFTGG